MLKGGTALALYYGLPRFSEDIDLDSVTENGMNSLYKLITKNFPDWKITVPKDTSTTYRLKIHYGGQRDNGDEYVLKIDISARNVPFLRMNKFNINDFQGVKVYSFEDLAHMKMSAFVSRDKSRDLFDIWYILKQNPNIFTDNELMQIQNKIYYQDPVEMSELLKFEVIENNLIAQTDIETLEYIPLDVLEMCTKTIENRFKKDVEIEKLKTSKFLKTEEFKKLER